MLTETTTAGSNQYTYPTAGNPLGVSQPHAVSSISGNAYTYDANGSMTAAPGRTQTWDIFNRLASVTTATGTERYIYDADGNRLIRKNSPSTNLFTDDQEITLTGSTLTGTRYYGTSAMRNGTTDLWYLTTNDQGSDTAAVQVATGTVTHELYDPWGKSRGTNGPPAGDRSFLNKPTDQTGLTYLGARFYDPAIHKFLSTDPLTAVNDPQNLNPYSYAGNNPTTKTDPTGLATGPYVVDDRPSWWWPTTPVKPAPAPPAAKFVPKYWLNTLGVSSGNTYGKTSGGPLSTFKMPAKVPVSSSKTKKNSSKAKAPAATPKPNVKSGKTAAAGAAGAATVACVIAEPCGVGEGAVAASLAGAALVGSAIGWLLAKVTKGPVDPGGPVNENEAGHHSDTPYDDQTLAEIILGKLGADGTVDAANRPEEADIVRTLANGPKLIERTNRDGSIAMESFEYFEVKVTVNVNNPSQSSAWRPGQ
jgi:RHS repeat-associated protein